MSILLNDSSSLFSLSSLDCFSRNKMKNGLKPQLATAHMFMRKSPSDLSTL